MKITKMNAFSAAVAGLGMIGAVSSPAFAATTMTAQWFTIAPDGKDFGPIICCNVYNNIVQSTLGPNGFPVVNQSYGGPILQDVNAATQELTWWNPALNANVTLTSTTTVNLPINQSMYIPNGTGGNDSQGFQGAIFTGTLVVPTTESVTFTFGSDDDAFIAIDNTIIAQNGGVHSNTPGPVTTSVLAPGSYLITLFYVDRQQSGAALNFSLDTQDVSIELPPSATPLPATLPLFASGIAGLGFFAHRKKRKQAA